MYFWEKSFFTDAFILPITWNWYNLQILPPTLFIHISYPNWIWFSITLFCQNWEQLQYISEAFYPYLNISSLNKWDIPRYYRSFKWPDKYDISLDIMISVPYIGMRGSLLKTKLRIFIRMLLIVVVDSKILKQKQFFLFFSTSTNVFLISVCLLEM